MNVNETYKALGGSSCARVLLALALFTASGAMAKDLPEFPPGAEQREAQLIKRVGPQTRAWIADEARHQAAQPELSAQMVVASVRANSALLGKPGDDDIMEIAFIVMMEAAKSNYEDLKSIMAAVESVNEAKAKVGQRDTVINHSKAAASQLAKPARARSAATVRNPMPTSATATLSIRPVPQAQPDKQIIKAKDNHDSLSEMSETESLRLQMATDRLSKTMSTLSDLLKKISDTSSDITGNLK